VPLSSLEGRYIQETFQYVTQVTGSASTSWSFADGLGNPVEIITSQNTSSMTVATASHALGGNGVFSGSFSGSYAGYGGALTGIVATAAPAGANKTIQFNDAGATSGSSNFTFDKTLNQVQLTGSISASLGANTVGFYGTSSWAVSASNTVSSSYALTASYAMNGGSGPATPTDRIVSGSVTASVNIVTESIFRVESSSIVYQNITNKGGVTIGLRTTGSGIYSHAEGYGTIANGTGSHAEGSGSIAGGALVITPAYSYYVSTSLNDTPIIIAQDTFYNFNNAYVVGTTSSAWYTAFYNGYNAGLAVTVTGSTDPSEYYVIEDVFDDTLGSGYYYLINSTGFTTNSFTVAYPEPGTVATGYYASAQVDVPESRSIQPINNTGQYSHAEGGLSYTAGLYSHAEGYFTFASGTASHTEGDNTLTKGVATHAEGSGSIASGSASHAEGFNTRATGSYSHVEGEGSITKGESSHAEGYFTIASGSHSHAEGYQTVSKGSYSHAEGTTTIASGSYSHAEGYGTIAAGDYSHAEGVANYAYSSTSHVEGGGNSIDINSHTAHAEGSGNTIRTDGRRAHAEGMNNVVQSEGAHVEGANNWVGATGGFPTHGVYAHAEGWFTSASGMASHAEGNGSKVLAFAAHAEGLSTYNIGYGAHTEGAISSASGQYSHAEGVNTKTLGIGSNTKGFWSIAYGTASMAWGVGVIASGSFATGSDITGSISEVTSSGVPQIAIGKWNLQNNTSSLFVIGNGGDHNNRSDLARFDSQSITFNQLVTGSQFYGNFYGNFYGTSSYVAGPWTSVQYNDSGSLTGSSNFTFNEDTNLVHIISGGLHVEGPAAELRMTSNGNVALEYYSNQNQRIRISAAVGYINPVNYGLYTGPFRIFGDSTNMSLESSNTGIFVNGYNATDIRVSASIMQVTSSLIVSGANATVSFPTLTNTSQPNVVTYDSTTGRIYYTASSALSAVPSAQGPEGAIQFNSASVITGSNKLIFDYANTTPAIQLSGSIYITGSSHRLFGTSSWSDNAVTASYVLNAVSSSYASTASYVATSSWANNVVSASYSLTASYASNGGVTQLLAGSNISLTPANGLGTVTITGTPINVSSGSNATASFTSQSTWEFTHNLGNRFVVIQAFDWEYNEIIPQNIQLTSVSSSVITFPTLESGYAVASLGGAGSSSYANYAESTALPDYIIISASYSITTANSIIEVVDPYITSSLPTAVGNRGKSFTLINASTGSVQLASVSAQKIGNGNPETATYQTVFQGDSITVVSNNSNWRII
jgi:hypothetical protein